MLTFCKPKRRHNQYQIQYKRSGNTFFGISASWIGTEGLKGIGCKEEGQPLRAALNEKWKFQLESEAEEQPRVAVSVGCLEG